MDYLLVGCDLQRSMSECPLVTRLHMLERYASIHDMLFQIFAGQMFGSDRRDRLQQIRENLEE